MDLRKQKSTQPNFLSELLYCNINTISDIRFNTRQVYCIMAIRRPSLHPQVPFPLASRDYAHRVNRPQSMVILVCYWEIRR